jgi:phosphatidylinositol dimannoside acyltransferase
MGVAYAAPPLIARHAPVTTLYRELPFEALCERVAPDLDIEGIQVPGPSIISRAVGALRAGRVLSLYPELSPGGIGRLHRPVSFLGTRVGAPGGTLLIAERTGAVLVPMVLRRTGPARFRFEVGELIDPRGDGSDHDELLQHLFTRIESFLLAGPPGEWEMWAEFDRMVMPASEPVPA